MAAKKIGVLSDTHGLLRAEAAGTLRDCDLILHAGDIGGPSILAELRTLAQVVAVRGNVDTGSWAGVLNLEEYVDIEGRRVVIIHDLSTLSLDPVSAGVDIVIYGHSHKPALERRDGILYLNPGSAGPKRFHLPVSMAILSLEGKAISPEFIELSA